MKSSSICVCVQVEFSLVSMWVCGYLVMYVGMYGLQFSRLNVGKVRKTRASTLLSAVSPKQHQQPQQPKKFNQHDDHHEDRLLKAVLGASKAIC